MRMRDMPAERIPKIVANEKVVPPPPSSAFYFNHFSINFASEHFHVPLYDPVDAYAFYLFPIENKIQANSVRTRENHKKNICKIVCTQICTRSVRCADQKRLRNN